MMLALLLGCTVPSDQLAAIEARLAVLEAERAVAPTVHEELRGLEVRIEAVEAATLDRAAGTLLTDPETGRVTPVLTPEQVRRCVYSALESLHNAQMAYDAAYDSFTADFERLGWRVAGTRGCDTHYAVRVRVSKGDFTADAVITRGAQRGRSYQVGTDGVIYDAPERSESEVLAFVAGAGWVGSPG